MNNKNGKMYKINLIKIFIVFFCVGQVACASDFVPKFELQNIYNVASYQPKVDELEKMFKQKIGDELGVIFTKVPRGLIMSFDERIFFESCQTCLNPNSYTILDTLAKALKTIPNDFVIENHTEDNAIACNCDFTQNWELSIMRAENMAQYLIDCGNLDTMRMFSLGFGEIMPFADNVSEKYAMDNRVDIVILQYEAER